MNPLFKCEVNLTWVPTRKEELTKIRQPCYVGYLYAVAGEGISPLYIVSNVHSFVVLNGLASSSTFSIRSKYAIL